MIMTQNHAISTRGINRTDGAIFMDDHPRLNRRFRQPQQIFKGVQMPRLRIIKPADISIRRDMRGQRVLIRQEIKPFIAFGFPFITHLN